MINYILGRCDQRYRNHVCGQCDECSFGNYCPHNCESCLDFIHNPSHAPGGAPRRKYDCVNMADFYTCKYSCRYTSELIYAIERCNDLKNLRHLKVMSVGCGPCTDLFAIDYLHSVGILNYETLEYRGIDYSEEVWCNVHSDIKSFESENTSITFYYQDVCEIINIIDQRNWVPDLMVFQYVFSDMQKHTNAADIQNFMNTFAHFYNTKVQTSAYTILNDINLSNGYGGGREHFDALSSKLAGSIVRKGRFCNDNATSIYYPRGYTYGENSDGEFPNNQNKFDLRPWSRYSPFDTCASAQMIIKKVR